MFFERRCPLCGRGHRTACRACIDGLELLAEAQTPWGAQLTALFAYDEASARLVLAAKNGGRRDLLRWAGHHLGAVVRQRDAGSSRRLDAVTWVPAHPQQRRTRGYDQGQVLARAVAKQLRVPARPLLIRSGGTSQRGLGRADRLAGPQVRCRRPVGGNILLVDDVMATGASLSRCAEALQSGGAQQVTAAVVAASTQNSRGLSAQSVSTIYIGASSGVRPEAT